MSLSPSDNSTVSLEEHSHLTPDLGTVPIHNTFPIDLTHAALLWNYPLLSLHLDDLKHQFKWHQIEQYLIFNINTGLMEYQPQKTQQYWFHPYTSLMSASSSRWTPSHLIKLNNDIHRPHSDISAEHHWQPFNPLTIQSPSLSQPFNGELGTRVTLPMLQIVMKFDVEYTKWMVTTLLTALRNSSLMTNEDNKV